MCTCVHAFCNEVTIEVIMAQKRKKSCDTPVKLKSVESAEKKLKKTATCEFGVEAKRFQGA